MDKLTPKQQAFADEYIINGGNATQAAIKAGYSKKTAEVTGSKLLRNVKVLDYLAKKVTPVIKKRNIDIQAQLNSLLDIYNGDKITSHSKQIDHLKGNKTVKNTTYEYTPDLESRLKALDLFLKYASPLLQAQTQKAQADAELAKLKAEAIKNATSGAVEDKLDELLNKIGGELDD